MTEGTSTATRPNQLRVIDITYVATWRGRQYPSIIYTELLAGAGIEPSVGSDGDPYENAMAEPIGNISPAEPKKEYHELEGSQAMAA